jgi:hypothetical protein
MNIEMENIVDIMNDIVKRTKSENIIKFYHTTDLSVYKLSEYYQECIELNYRGRYVARLWFSVDEFLYGSEDKLGFFEFMKQCDKDNCGFSVITKKCSSLGELKMKLELMGL